MAKAQHVPMRPTIAMLVLRHLPGKSIGSLLRVPLGESFAHRATEPTTGLDGFKELEEMRTNAADARHGFHRGLPSFALLASNQGQREDSRVVLRGASLVADFHDATDSAGVVRA